MSENKTPRVDRGKIVGQIDAAQMPGYGGIATIAHFPQISMEGPREIGAFSNS